MYQTYRAYREQISVLCSRWEHCPQKCVELILELSRSIQASNRTLDIPTRSIGKLAQGRRQDFLSHLGQKYPPQLKINLRGLESIVVSQQNKLTVKVLGCKELSYRENTSNNLVRKKKNRDLLCSSLKTLFLQRGL